MTPMNDATAPQREPDGQVENFYFWLGDDTDYEDETADMGIVDQSEFDFNEGRDGGTTF